MVKYGICVYISIYIYSGISFIHSSIIPMFRDPHVFVWEPSRHHVNCSVNPVIHVSGSACCFGEPTGRITLYSDSDNRSVDL